MQEEAKNDALEKEEEEEGRCCFVIVVRERERDAQ